MSKQESPLQLRFILNPVYWFTWLGIGLLYLSSFLPYSVMLKLGTALGWLFYILVPARRRIIRTNIRLAFPELNKKQINSLVRQSFISTALAIFESAMAWWADKGKIIKISRIEGEEHLKAAEAMGKGVLMLGGHYTTLEISGRILALIRDNVYPTYKRAHNPLFEIFMRNNRTRMNKGLVASHDMRGTLKVLKQNDIIWYASDQDFGPDRSVFAPFMGVQTATITMSARLAKRAGAPIVPFYSERLPNNEGYLIRFGPVLENFPTGDDVTDATLVNQVIEEQVRRTPEQYLWGHRRFKTCPRGEPQRYEIRRERHIKAYTLAHALLALPVIAYTIWVSFKHKQSKYLFERLGLSKQKQANMIIHAASIGEVNAIAPLVKLILNKNPKIKLLLSINTPSGMKTAQQLFSDKVDFCYMPIDWRWSVRRYLNHIAPQAVLIAETEIWYNFSEFCYLKGIKNVIINGRLSARSIDTPYTVRRWISQSLQFTYAVLARSEDDAQRFTILGMHKDYVRVLGNIKYSVDTATAAEPVGLSRPFILIASSRDDEEKLIYEKLSTIHNLPLIVIVPRHIKRLPDILNDLSDYKDKISVRSKNEEITARTKIYIADTFGELPGFIAGSQFVIMGGSFQPFGGQNIIEVAREQKAVIFGPHMENFSDEARQFIDANAAIQVSSVEQLDTIVQQLLDEPAQANRMGQNGHQLIMEMHSIVDHYYQELRKLELNLAE